MCILYSLIGVYIRINIGIEISHSKLESAIECDYHDFNRTLLG